MPDPFTLSEKSMIWQTLPIRMAIFAMILSNPAGMSPDDAPRRTRTYNPLIKSQLLCQLS
jgi:hypothetical protein